MRMLIRGLALAALLLCAPFAAAQHATTSAAPAGFAPEMAPVTVAATSTPATNAAITTATTLAFTPQLGRPIRIVVKLTAGSSYDAQVTTSPDGCTTKNPLTIAGQTWASYSGQTGPLNEDVDVPMIPGISYCLTITPGSGATVSAAVRQ